MRFPVGKRALDLVLLTPCLPVFAPLIGFMAAAVWLTGGRPVFFRQPRLGLGGRHFHIVKIRTMTTEPDPRQRRPTRLGGWLRRRGLDELPQIVNVLRGEMSLVGPRPLTAEDHARLIAEHPPFASRLEVPPGLTGLSQVTLARGARLTAELDWVYARTRTTGMDIAILLRTVWMTMVGKRRGARNLPRSEIR